MAITPVIHKHIRYIQPKWEIIDSYMKDKRINNFTGFVWKAINFYIKHN